MITSMKKTLLLLIACFAVLTMQAQTGHLKFMGIPLDGPIERFHQKMLVKGCRVNREDEFRGLLPPGSRSYTGTFVGKRANIIVFYNESDKIVYGAKAYFDRLTEAASEEEYNRVKTLLQTKYPDVETVEEAEGELKYLTLMPSNGTIMVYQKKSRNYADASSPYSLHIEYTDETNDKTNEKSPKGNALDDL